MSANGNISAATVTAATALPPDPALPYWHSPDGRRLSYSDVATGLVGDELARRDALHCDATLAMLRAGMERHREGRHREALELLTHASRLCREPVGHWPAWAANPGP